MIVTGDDFGLSFPVNEAVARAHESGILTSTSLMVTGDAAEDAIQRAKSLPSLKVGLHLVLTHGLAKLGHSDIPDLVNTENQFATNQVSSGIKMYFNAKVKTQLEAEIRAQFEAFQQTGLELDHVNTHKHMHLHPTVSDLILKVAKDFGLGAMRLPNEPPLETLIDNNIDRWHRYQRYYFLKPWVNILEKKLSTQTVKYNQQTLGLHDSGHMTIDTVIRMLAHVEDGITELYCHPATGHWENMDPEAKDYEYEAELKMLTHPRIKRAIDKFDIELTSFSNI